jgi:hypothetical protein
MYNWVSRVWKIGGRYDSRCSGDGLYGGCLICTSTLLVRPVSANALVSLRTRRSVRGRNHPVRSDGFRSPPCRCSAPPYCPDVDGAVHAGVRRLRYVSYPQDLRWQTCAMKDCAVVDLSDSRKAKRSAQITVHKGRYIARGRRGRTATALPC